MNLLRKPFRYNFCNATLIIAGVNILFYLAGIFCNKFGIIFYLNTSSYGNVAIDFDHLLALNPPLVVKDFFLWQPVTAMFIHANFQHLLFNMLGLIMFGMNVEKSIGSKEFTLYYFVCGITANLFSLLVYVLTGQNNVFLMGASGAVYSILFAFAVIFPTVRIFIFGIIPVPGPVLILIYAIVEVVDQMFGLKNGVAHMTHLSGFAAAWAYFVIRMGVNPIKVWKNASRR